MKKLGLGLVCLTSVLFSATSAQAGWDYNWLAGVSGGYAAQEGTYHLELSLLGPPVVVPGSPNAINLIDISQADAYSGFIWGLLVGYQGKCNGWIVGGELNVDFQNIYDTNPYAFTVPPSNPPGNNLGVNASVSYKRETIIGLTARIGYQLSQYFAPYIRLGLESSKDRLTTVFVPNINFIGIPVTFQNEDSRWQYSFVGGAGLEFSFPKVLSCMSVRLQYDYHSRCTNGHSLFIAAADNVTFTLDGGYEKPHEQTGKISLVWNFA